MNSLMQVQQTMLSRMEQIRTLSESGAVKPAAAFQGEAPEGIAAAFDRVMDSINAQQHQAATAAEAVDSGKSDDLLGAMIESQKASVSFSALMQVRNKVTGAFEEILRMPM